MEDIAGKFNTLKQAEDYASGMAPNTSVAYHNDRIRCLAHLINKLNLKPDRILDFGCGDGMYAQYLGLLHNTYIGIDLNESMINLATQKFSGNPKFTGIVGSTNKMKYISESVDLVLAIDVIAYLTDDEEHEFYHHSSRLLKKGGLLIVMTGNELFDMFALNAGTVDFFKDNFDQNVGSLLVENSSQRFKNSKRKNPLSYDNSLNRYGFIQKDIAFSQYHRSIPGNANRDFDFDVQKARLAMRDHEFDPNNRISTEQWKSYFDCSLFGMTFERV